MATVSLSGNLVRLDSPDTGTATYTYDAAGNRTSQTDARGVTASYTYDALNRLIAIRYPPPAGDDVEYAYDTPEDGCDPAERFAIGRLSRVTDASGSTAYCHDHRGNLTRKTQETGRRCGHGRDAPRRNCRSPRPRRGARRVTGQGRG